MDTNGSRMLSGLLIDAITTLGSLFCLDRVCACFWQPRYRYPVSGCFFGDDHGNPASGTNTHCGQIHQTHFLRRKKASITATTVPIASHTSG